MVRSSSYRYTSPLLRWDGSHASCLLHLTPPGNPSLASSPLPFLSPPGPPSAGSRLARDTRSTSPATCHHGRRNTFLAVSDSAREL
jgi:hypothetical protein